MIKRDILRIVHESAGGSIEIFDELQRMQEQLSPSNDIDLLSKAISFDSLYNDNDDDENNVNNYNNEPSNTSPQQKQRNERKKVISDEVIINADDDGGEFGS